MAWRASLPSARGLQRLHRLERALRDLRGDLRLRREHLQLLRHVAAGRERVQQLHGSAAHLRAQPGEAQLLLELLHGVDRRGDVGRAVGAAAAVVAGSK